MKQLTPYLIGFILSLVLTVLLQSNINKQPKTKVFICNNASDIVKLINTWTKIGYEVESLNCQSVSTSIDDSYQYYRGINYRDVKGDMILIMVKD